MASPKARRKKEAAEAENELLTALKFVAPAMTDDGENIMPYQLHVSIANNYVVAFNGVVAIGFPTTSTVELYPHGKRLLDAIGRARECLTITQQQGHLAVVSGRFRAYVPCADTADMHALPVNPPMVPLPEENRLLWALQTAGTFVVEGSERVVTACVQLTTNTATGTDGIVCLQAWHGLRLPEMLIPKAAIVLLTRLKKEPVSLGFSDRTVTFWFADRSWFRTQLYAEKYVDTEKLFAGSWQTLPIPEGFADAVSAVEPFSADDTVYLRDGAVCSHRSRGAGAEHEVAGIPAAVAFNAGKLGRLVGLCTNADLVGQSGISYFAGPGLRSVFAQKVYR